MNPWPQFREAGMLLIMLISHHMIFYNWSKPQLDKGNLHKPGSYLLHSLTLQVHAHWIIYLVNLQCRLEASGNMMDSWKITISILRTHHHYRCTPQCILSFQIQFQVTFLLSDSLFKDQNCVQHIISNLFLPG